jgi:hypothetical protein
MRVVFKAAINPECVHEKIIELAIEQEFQTDRNDKKQIN